MGDEGDLSGRLVDGGELHFQIGHGQQRAHFFGPLGQFEPRACEDVTKARVFPFLRVAEPIEIKVPDVTVCHGVRLHNGIGGALDTSLHAQRLQQVAYQRGLACPQVALQANEGVVQGGALRPSLRKSTRRVLGIPAYGVLRKNRAFYNGRVTINSTQRDDNQLVSQIQAWGQELGFSQIGMAGVDLGAAEPGLLAWLAQGFHGEMHYMEAHGLRRARPAELVPGTVSVITARMPYLPRQTAEDWQTVEWARIAQPAEGVISMYARGRDYHKVLRQRLQKLAERIAQAVGPLGYRVFTDSAPVLEAELAARSGLGWRGKHTLILSRDSGSLFFLGEIYVDMVLPATQAASAHCGSCDACMRVCPTQAIVAPMRLDARRCISYLTIEHKGSIPLELRPLMGNRIYGCDDCQLACPWNKFAQRTTLPDFDPREGMTGSLLVNFMGWTEAQFLSRTEGSPIRRIGHAQWLRNVAVALGNALRANPLHAQRDAMVSALSAHSQHENAVVREHVEWALQGAGR